MMNRINIIQTCLDQTKGKTYLEIGVAFGVCITRIRAVRKIAVDPKIRMPWLGRKLCEGRATETWYFETTSDEFFDNNDKFLGQTGISVALVDGLHTYEQSLKDVENILLYLDENGSIVMHDWNPTRATMAYPADSYMKFKKDNWWHWLWCGDVWKTIVHLRSTRSDLEVAVLNCDFGVGVIKRGNAKENLSYSPDAIKAMSYDDLENNRERILNLKDPDYLRVFLE
jgi:hypothetical protein